MAIYHVNEARHNQSIVAVALNSTNCVVYSLEYLGSSKGNYQEITREQLLDPSYDWYDHAVYLTELNGFAHIHKSRVMSKSDNTFYGGDQYLHAIDNGINILVNLGSIKYPAYEIEDWRYEKYRMLRPVFKMVFHTDAEDFLNTDRVYYFSNTSDTLFITNDIIPETYSLDSDLDVYPNVTMNTLDNGDIQIHLEYSNGVKPSGILKLDNYSGLLLNYLPVVNGDTILSHNYVVGSPFADLLWGYKKIGELVA